MVRITSRMLPLVRRKVAVAHFVNAATGVSLTNRRANLVAMKCAVLALARNSHLRHVSAA